MDDLVLSILEAFKQSIDGFAMGCISKIVNESCFTSSEPRLLLCLGKNAELFAHAFISNNIEFEKIIAVQPSGYSLAQSPNNQITLFESTHPYVTETTIEVTKHVLGILEQFKGIIHVLVTGGTSASFALPLIPLNNYNAVIKDAMDSGFPIEALNYLRSRIDGVKGGNLLHYGKIYSWVVSDVISDDPRVIGSGPSVPGIESYPGVLDLLAKHKIEPVAILSKEENNLGIKIIGTRHDLLTRLTEILEIEDTTTRIVNSSLMGNIESCKNEIAQYLERYSEDIMIFSGEPTITTLGFTGKGGRLSHLLCSMIPITKATILGIATDGKDGSSPHSIYYIEPGISTENLGDALVSGDTGSFLSSNGLGIELEYENINLLDIYMIIRTQK
ncbi:MAG: DUF4147 domain-containing protein [Candidatus Heimdallarchaeota archaeon]|nr:DUF4147 domain-containing protein [Candidatus Heimdallarchaeota archaeon]